MKQKRAAKHQQLAGTGKPVKGSKCSLCGRRDPIDGQACPASNAGMPHLILD